MILEVFPIKFPFTSSPGKKQSIILHKSQTIFRPRSPHFAFHLFLPLKASSRCPPIDSLRQFEIILIYYLGVMMGQYSQKVLGQARKTRGYLQKRSSGLLSVWQRRYFLILEEGLSYYADETLDEVKKSIPMQEIKNIKMNAECQFQLVTKKRIYELRAEDEATRDLWVASLNILINHKEWQQASVQSKKEPTSAKRHSKNKKVTSRGSPSPPQHRKTSSSSSARWLNLKNDFTAQAFFAFVCLPKMAEQWGRESIRNKALVLKEARGCYFLVSCKSLLYPQEDPQFLSEQLIHPYDFNCLYFFQFAKVNTPQVVQICKCGDIESVQAEPACIRVQLPTRDLSIRIEQKRMEVVDVQSIIRKLRAAAVIGREYHNPLKIKIKRNVDPLIYKYDTRQMTIEKIASKEFQGCIVEGRERKESKEGKETKDSNGPTKNEFKKSLQNLKRNFKEVFGCCEVKGPIATQFKQQYAKIFHQKVSQYVQKGWNSLGKSFSSFQMKKIVLNLQQLCRTSRELLGQGSLLMGSITILRGLVEKYQQEINGKINNCFLLSQEELIGEVSIPVKGEEEALANVDTIFLSNTVFRQFHLDIRLVLYEFSEMPVHEKALEYYLNLFANTFRYISEQTFRFLDKWKDLRLILGTCNEIQFIKNSLFQEMFQKLTRDYPQMSGRLKRQSLRELQGEINGIQIMLVKKLFVMTFSDIDRNLLNKPYDQLNITAICLSILAKLRALPKINRYVKRNIFEASFEEICYFYYTSIIKFTRNDNQQRVENQIQVQPQPQPQTADFFARKIGEDIRSIGQQFEGSINTDKIYTHLKDLSLIKEFLQCEISQVKKLCRSLKKQFGNSFTETAVKNLLSLRDVSPQLKDGLIVECTEIVKNSADTPEEISLISSSRESFLENWNNTRSRKSTLTLSLNEFYENQQAIHAGRQQCSQFKQGFLTRRRLHKDVPEARVFFSIRSGELLEHADNSTQSEIIASYDLHSIRKCYLHPQKNYVFFVETGDAKLQMKAENAEQAKEWIRNIYEEISSLSMAGMEREKQKSQLLWASPKNMDPSTMDSYQKQKTRSMERSNASSPKMKRVKQEQNKKQEVNIKPQSPERPQRTEKPVPQDNCLKCSKGFFF